MKLEKRLESYRIMVSRTVKGYGRTEWYRTIAPDLITACKGAQQYYPDGRIIQAIHCGSIEHTDTEQSHER